MMSRAFIVWKHLILWLLSVAPSSRAQVPFAALNRSFTPVGAPPQKSQSNSAVESPSSMLTALPAPTGLWWSSWVQLTGTDVSMNAVDMQPYRVKVLTTGLSVGSPHDLTWDGCGSGSTCIWNGYVRPVTISTGAGLTTVDVESYDDLSVTFRWRPTAGGAVSMRATLMQGMPYITVQFIAAAPVFETILGEVWLGTRPASLTGSKMKLLCSSSITWLIYSSASTTLTTSSPNNNIRATGPSFTATMRLAMQIPRFSIPYGWTRANLLGNATAFESLLDTYKDVYPTGGSVTLGIQSALDSPTGKARPILSYTFTTANMAGGSSTDLLMFSMPHHRNRLVTPAANPTLALTCKGVRGNLRTVVGSTWTLAYPSLPDITWAATKPVDPTYVQPIISQLLSTDVNNGLNGLTRFEVYKASQQLADMPPSLSPNMILLRMLQARTAQIASELTGFNNSLVAAVTILQGRLKTNLALWLSPQSPVDYGLVYDPKWGGIISYNPAKANSRDAQRKNNAYWHHLSQYGPFLYAAAVTAKADPTWGNTVKSAVLGLVRDMANPRRDDPWFPPARAMDWCAGWAGHAWEVGLVTSATDGDIVNFGRWQELSGSAVAAYYSMALFGSAVSDPELMAWGQVLAAIEADSARMYFQ
ncbi:Endo-1,3(4)-beta-glucanase 1, partial [Tetrabaena socialis]